MEDDKFVNLWRKEFPKVFRNGLGTCNKKIQLQLVDSNLLSEIFIGENDRWLPNMVVFLDDINFCHGSQ